MKYFYKHDFNPRSREGSDIFTNCIPICNHISIHAPARGATKKYKLIEIEDVNFNPRSREGSDKTVRARFNAPGDFNPRSREGSDSSDLWSAESERHFNPRSREGSDG